MSKSKSSGLTMSNATYARSAAGKTKLKNDFYGDIDNLIKILNGDKYKSFKSTISNNWVGTDATDFLNDIDKTRGSLEKSLKALKTKFASAIDSDYRQFGSFQNKNTK